MFPDFRFGFIDVSCFVLFGQSKRKVNTFYPFHIIRNVNEQPIAKLNSNKKTHAAEACRLSPPNHLHKKTIPTNPSSFPPQFPSLHLASMFPCHFFQLEILPAAGLPNLVGLKQRQPAPALDSSGSRKASGSPPRASGKNDGKNRGGGSDAATRALAALPKGMRFSAPRAADKSRAANRRQLAASARAVANDRWAAQLGYQDGEEHIRDLK